MTQKIKIGGVIIKPKDIPPELRQRIELELKKCPYCGSSNVIKNGIRHNQSGNSQIFGCNACDRRFTPTKQKTAKRTTYLSTIVKQLKASGESFRNIAGLLKSTGVNVSHVSVFKWCQP